MDIGKFKASRGRLLAWIAIPPVLIVGIGLSSFGLRLQSEWKLERTRVLADILPQVQESRLTAEALIAEFGEDVDGVINSEDEFISFIQNVAGQVGFTVDTLRVERRNTSATGGTPLLVASVKGTGTFLSVQNLMGDVASSQPLLTESSLKVTQGGRIIGEESCTAEIIFELILFNSGASRGNI